jgi:hypothetical protein
MSATVAQSLVLRFIVQPPQRQFGVSDIALWKQIRAELVQITALGLG